MPGTRVNQRVRALALARENEQRLLAGRQQIALGVMQGRKLGLPPRFGAGAAVDLQGQQPFVRQKGARSGHPLQQGVPCLSVDFSHAVVPAQLQARYHAVCVWRGGATRLNVVHEP